MPEIRCLDTSDPGFASALAKLTAHDKADDDAIDASVASIITDVRVRGDAAVLEYTACSTGSRRRPLPRWNCLQPN
jgi:histidinol dehydrogenase